MSAAVVALALAAAVTHAAWNAFLRSGADRLWTVTVMSMAMTVVALPFAALLPLPPGAAWPYLVLSAALQVGYSVLLVAAYRQGDLGQVYPIIRGSVPLLVALGGFVLAGQALRPASIAGIVLIASGIMGLAVGQGRAKLVPVLWALAAGLVIAAYAMVDAVGVRAAGDPIAYTAWICLLYGAFLPATFVLARGRIAIDARSPETWKAAGGGLASLAAYGLVVAAFAAGPAGPVTALRETSVVFASLIGWAFLGEPVTRRRLLACFAVTIGAICIGYGG